MRQALAPPARLLPSTGGMQCFGTETVRDRTYLVPRRTETVRHRTETVPKHFTLRTTSLGPESERRPAAAYLRSHAVAASQKGDLLRHPRQPAPGLPSP